MAFNEIFHWIFTIYPVVYLQIACLSISALACGPRSLLENQCDITGILYFLTLTPLVISYIHGQILIYIMRNHRFYEVNSLKRRYSYILLLNNTIILLVIFFHYFNTVFTFLIKDSIWSLSQVFFAWSLRIRLNLWLTFWFSL